MQDCSAYKVLHNNAEEIFNIHKKLNTATLETKRRHDTRVKIQKLHLPYNKKKGKPARQTGVHGPFQRQVWSNYEQERYVTALLRLSFATAFSCSFVPSSLLTLFTYIFILLIFPSFSTGLYTLPLCLSLFIYMYTFILWIFMTNMTECWLLSFYFYDFLTINYIHIIVSSSYLLSKYLGMIFFTFQHYSFTSVPIFKLSHITLRILRCVHK